MTRSRKNQANWARSSLKKETTSKLSMFVSANKLGDSLLPAETLNCVLHPDNLVSWWAPNRVVNLVGPCWSRWTSHCSPFSFPPAIHQAHLLSTRFSAPSGGSFDAVVLNSLPNEDKILCRRVKLVLFSSFPSVIEIFFLLEKILRFLLTRQVGISTQRQWKWPAALCSPMIRDRIHFHSPWVVCCTANEEQSFNAEFLGLFMNKLL